MLISCLWARNVQELTPFHQIFDEKGWVLVSSCSLYRFSRNIQGLTPFHQKVYVLVCSRSEVRGPETYKNLHLFTKGAKICQKWPGVRSCMFLVGIYRNSNVQELTLFQNIFRFWLFLGQKHTRTHTFWRCLQNSKIVKK